MAATYKIFISHSWSYADAYDRLVEMLRSKPNFSFMDYSVPRNDPIHNAPTQRALYDAIKDQMRPCNIVLIMAGKYASYSEWINKEIEIAKVVFSKPLIGICPWGAEQISKVVATNANELVGWNTDSIVSAIRRWAI